MSKLRVAVLASGSGTLFQSLADHAGELEIEIVGLITDGEVPAVARAHALGIPVTVVPMLADRVKWDQELATELSKLKPAVIVSAGFMRILGPIVLRFYQGRIINTHPAMLPKFPGAHAVRDALAAKVSSTGATVHFVDSGMDTGEIIAQAPVNVEPDDTEELLHERIKQVERTLLVQVVRDIVSGKVVLK